MEFFSRLPGTSLGMLLVTYLVFGYNLPRSDFARFLAARCIGEPAITFSQFSDTSCWSILRVWVWVAGGISAVVLSALLTAPLRRTKKFLMQWIRTDLGLFISSTLVVCTVVLLLWKLHIFATGMVLFAAGALARLNLQTAEFSEWQAFWLLAIASLVGLGLGWILHYPELLLKFLS